MSFMHKAWEALSLINIGLISLSVGIFTLVGPVFIWSAAANFSVVSWGVAFVFAAIGIAFSVNTLYVFWESGDAGLVVAIWVLFFAINYMEAL